MKLLSNGAIELLPTAYYGKQSLHDIMLWCHYHARYGLPTIELVEWLKARIGGRTAIEIGAGSGDLCHHLGIPGFDNYQQRDFADVVEYYKAFHQPTIKYAPWVQKMDAVQAVRQRAPQVVVASWVTQWVDPAKTPSFGSGSIYGVKEDQFIGDVETYIVIGNKRIHGNKAVLKLPHQELMLPFVKSRASRPDLDRVYIWGK